jgi:hypothetical protein
MAKARLVTKRTNLSDVSLSMIGESNRDNDRVGLVGLAQRMRSRSVRAVRCWRWRRISAPRSCSRCMARALLWELSLINTNFVNCRSLFFTRCVQGQSNLPQSHYLSFIMNHHRLFRMVDGDGRAAASAQTRRASARRYSRHLRFLCLLVVVCGRLPLRPTDFGFLCLVVRRAIRK